MLATTQDYAISDLPFIAKVLLAPFNHHRLHHLLPGVDESRLPELEGVLQRTCAEFGEPYNLYSWTTLAAGSVRNWLNLSPPPEPSKAAAAAAGLSAGGAKAKKQQ